MPTIIGAAGCIVVVSDVLMTGIMIAFSSDRSSAGSTVYFAPMLFFFGFFGGLRTIFSVSLYSSSESLKSGRIEQCYIPWEIIV